nr:UDP-N-acetylmuramate--L-alanine ligase [Maliibacterium massiliense]
MTPDIHAHKDGHVHFIGIGGSSMNGLADILLYNGYTISGSDMSDSPILDALCRKGATVYVGHDAAHIKGATLIVHTAAVHPDNPEMIAAKAAGIPIMDRATLLGQIMAQYPTAIGVSGTHGKTTTTSMLATILELSGLDPTIHIGGQLDLIGGSTKSGSGPYFVTEACEYVESFLKFHPTIAIILNIDADHLDYFRDIDHIQQAFTRFAGLLPQGGALIVNGDDVRALQVAAGVACDVISFGIENTGCTFVAKDISFDAQGHARFRVLHEGALLGDFALSIPGRHNVYNALAAIAAAVRCGLEAPDIARGFARFHGAQRRFEEEGTVGGARVIHDYAHHPREVQTLIETAALQHPRRIFAIFQPHTYTRTKLLFDAFTKAFDAADVVIVTDIYAAREANTGIIHARDLVQALKNRGVDCHYIAAFADIARFIKAQARPGDVVLTIGAGTIEKLAPMLVEG